MSRLFYFIIFLCKIKFNHQTKQYLSISDYKLNKFTFKIYIKFNCLLHIYAYCLKNIHADMIRWCKYSRAYFGQPISIINYIIFRRHCLTVSKIYRKKKTVLIFFVIK